MVKKRPEFNYKNCVNCRICVQACPSSSLALNKEGLNGKYKNYFPQLVSDDCIGCAMCQKACPMECITMVECNEN